MRTDDVSDVGRDYESFALRGEGMANFVVAATHKASRARVVWRFRKEAKTRVVREMSDAVSAREFLVRVMEPALGRRFLLLPSVRRLRGPEVAAIAATPSLCDYFPPPPAPPLSALQMPDFSDFPSAGARPEAPVITFEIKPKQAFKDPSLDAGSPCVNCLSQFEKWEAGRYAKFYDFCPTQLFASSRTSVTAAIHSLIKIPHNNLKISRNGELIHCEDFRLAPQELEAALGPISLNEIVDVLARVLTGSPRSLGDSVLGRLRSLQSSEQLGVFGAEEVFASLPSALQAQLKNPYALFRVPTAELGPTLSELRTYALASSLQDCSLLVSLCADARPWADEEAAGGPVPIRRVSVGGRSWAVRVAVVDLDAKSPKRVLKKAQRLRDAAAAFAERERRFGPMPRPCRR